MADFTTKIIRDVRIGDTVIGLVKNKSGSGYNNFAVATVINLSKRNGKTIKIKTIDSSIELTPDHQLMGSTANRQCNDWKLAKSFSPYEYLRYIGSPMPESKEIQIGWLSGFCDGDGCFFKYSQMYNGFEAVCEDNQLRSHFLYICKQFNIHMRESQKQSSKKAFNKGRMNKMVCTRQSAEVIKLKNLISFSKDKSDDFYKGYIAGMIDTDGSIYKSIRIFQSIIANKEKYERIRFCLDKLNIKYVEERAGFRLLGGFKLRMMLLMEFQIRHSKKSQNLLLWGFSIKGSEHSEIESVTRGRETEVYNLETDCGNYIANGFIVHNCYNIGKPFFVGGLRFMEKNLKDNLGKGNMIFVGSSNDLFAERVPTEWIIKTLEYCKKFDNTYLFQTKNPARFLEFINDFPKKIILCITLETNRWYEQMGNAPHPDERAAFFSELREYEKCVTVEPIMSFDLTDFVTMIKVIRPTKVFIGADSKNHHLPEPSKEQVEQLIKELRKFTEVIIKSNILRVIGNNDLEKVCL